MRNIAASICHGCLFIGLVASLGGCGGDDKISPSAASNPLPNAASDPSPSTATNPSPSTAANSSPSTASVPSPGTPSDPSPEDPVLAADQPYVDPNQYGSGDSDSLAPELAVEKAAITHHWITLGEQKMAYTATAGHLSASDPIDNTPEVSVFYAAYTLDGKPPGSRPVTFLFNGGPGSASVYLHLGSWGPRRVLTRVPDSNTDFPLIDTTDSLLADTDLVFIDAPATGYSEAIAPNTNGTFMNADKDAAVFRDFIARYITVNGRQTSPKYLYGESYSGIRTPIVANFLAVSGIKISGVILNSVILNYKTECDVGGKDCAEFLPTYAAVSSYYGLSDKPATMSLSDYIQPLRGYTLGAYKDAIRNFNKNPSIAPSDSMITRLAGLTGLSEQDWTTNFNMKPYAYRSGIASLVQQKLGLPRKPGLDVNDGRIYGGNDYESGIEKQIGPHLDSFMKYTSSSEYVASNYLYFDMSHNGSSQPDTVPDLFEAMTYNPGMKVFAASGYYDLNCPFDQVETELGRMGVNKNVQMKIYEGGHMLYLSEPVRAPMRSDLGKLYSEK